jgi:hypothetical protein
MKKIIIYECYSSSVNYIHDIRQKGYEPVLLEEYAKEEYRDNLREYNDKVYSFNGDEIPTVIMASEKYENTLEIVKKNQSIIYYSRL